MSNPWCSSLMLKLKKQERRRSKADKNRTKQKRSNKAKEDQRLGGEGQKGRGMAAAAARMMTPEELFVALTVTERRRVEMVTPLLRAMKDFRLFHTSLFLFRRETGNAHLLLMFAESGMDDLSMKPVV